MDNGFSDVPEEIVQELKDLCMHMQPKRDHGDSVSRPAKMTRVSDDNAMTLLGSAAANNSGDTFFVHPPPLRRSGPRELPETRARDLGKRLLAGISVLNQSQASVVNNLSTGSTSGAQLRDQAPCLLSNSRQDIHYATDEDGVIPHVGPEELPADVCTAALRTTEARRVLDETFSNLCEAIEAYNEAVRYEAHLSALHGLPFSP